MPSLSHLLLNFLELRPHAVASGFPFHLELSAAACSADEGEAQKIEGLRFSEPPMSAALHCEAADIFVELKPDDQVIGISHDNHVAHGLTMSPSLGPEIKHVVQVNVGEEWCDQRTLAGPPITD